MTLIYRNGPYVFSVQKGVGYIFLIFHVVYQTLHETYNET